MVHPVIKEAYEEIISLKVQGASNVAKRALKAIRDWLEREEFKDVEDMKEELKKAVIYLMKSRPTEPQLRESLVYILRKLKEKEDLPVRILKESLIYEIDNFWNEVNTLEEKVAEVGNNVIEDGMTIITHCHSNTLMKVLRRASKEKEFRVIVTETRPKYQGKITAKELLEMGVKVTYIVDSASYYFMKDADIYMTGADVITADGYVINKVGTALIALAADEFGVPYYVTTTSLKFDPATVLGVRELIEERDVKEVIDPEELKGAEIRNPAFDATPPKYVKAVISELGELPIYSFVTLQFQKRKYDTEAEHLITSVLFRK